ncbi:hypothetical protein HMPREF9440_01546 [Sutterella parvirubra YIT 11816]|uniref:Uncharacterized protein n=1 Tax=Sutterella parvirubra YIT 11816 TaxID=762967 RepID=H3KFM7_9BURK|nr:hypothetical protein HMPREF9440_01546 [Sutterella parvirubra YIT 11816]
MDLGGILGDLFDRKRKSAALCGKSGRWQRAAVLQKEKARGFSFACLLLLRGDPGRAEPPVRPSLPPSY